VCFSAHYQFLNNNQSVPHFHPAKSEPFLAQVLQRGADMIHRVVDAEEAIDEEAFRSSLLGA
jgi:hypothetical protein